MQIKVILELLFYLIISSCKIAKYVRNLTTYDKDEGGVNNHEIRVTKFIDAPKCIFDILIFLVSDLDCCQI